MHQKLRRLCQDVAVIRSADCCTDHKLLCTKVRVPPTYWTRHQRFDVSSLRNIDVRERYNNAVMREVCQGWDQEASGERKWKGIRKGMIKAAEVILGKEKKWQPDWLQENFPTL